MSADLPPMPKPPTSFDQSPTSSSTNHASPAGSSAQEVQPTQVAQEGFSSIGFRAMVIAIIGSLRVLAEAQESAPFINLFEELQGRFDEFFHSIQPRDIVRAVMISVGDAQDDPDVEHPDLAHEDRRNIARNLTNVQTIPDATWTEGRATPALVNIPFFDNFVTQRR